jgi:Uma2 family endonuclease
MVANEQVRWTIADLDLLPDNGVRYEIIDGELLMTRSPHWDHQAVIGNIYAELKTWSRATGLGHPAPNPGIVFSEADNVIPDVVWASNERYSQLIDEAGHLTGAPELVVEVLSPGEANERRDRQVKLKLYASQGVQEYWLADRRLCQIQVYRRERGMLKLVSTLFAEDELTSPLLPGFSCSVGDLFS